MAGVRVQRPDIRAEMSPRNEEQEMDGQALIEAMVAWWVQNETGTAQEAMAADLLIHATSRAFAESVPDATARVSAMIDEARHGLAEAKTDVIRVATAY